MSKSKVAVITLTVLCSMVVMDRLVSFIKTRIPPYSEGQCLSVDKNPYVKILIKKNDLSSASSEVFMTTGIFGNEEFVASFEDLRDINLTKVRCDD